MRTPWATVLVAYTCRPHPAVREKVEREFPAGTPCLPRQRVQNIGSDRLLQLDRSDGLIRSRSYPGFGGFAVAILFETADKLREPATEDPTGWATGEITAELL